MWHFFAAWAFLALGVLMSAVLAIDLRAGNRIDSVRDILVIVVMTGMAVLNLWAATNT